MAPVFPLAGWRVRNSAGLPLDYLIAAPETERPGLFCSSPQTLPSMAAKCDYSLCEFAILQCDATAPNDKTSAPREVDCCFYPRAWWVTRYRCQP